MAVMASPRIHGSCHISQPTSRAQPARHHADRQTETKLRWCLSFLYLTATWALLFLPLQSGASADEATSRPKTQAKVIGRIWKTRNLSREFSQYTQSLGRELNMQQSGAFFVAMGAQPGMLMGHNSSSQQNVTQGLLALLETSPTPGTPHLISFEQIGSIEEFRRRVQQRASQPGAELIGKDDRFEVKVNVRRFTLASPAQGKNGEKRISAVVRIDIGSSDNSDGAGQPKIRIPNSFSTWYRYHDGFMYVGQTDALHHVSLPAGETMQPESDMVEFDVHGRLDLRDVPEFLRQLVWQQWQAKALTLMQRLDNEEEGKHAVRHTLGEGKLELFRSALFDVDKVEFSFKLPKPKPSQKQPQNGNIPATTSQLQNRISLKFDSTDDVVLSTVNGPEFDDSPVTASIKVEARENSKLAAALQQLNERPSRLGTIRSDESPFLISSSLQLPEFSQDLATRFIDSLRTRLNETVEDSGVFLDEVFAPILAAVADRELDLALRMDGDAESGLVLTGGCRLPEAERFRSAVQSLLLAETDSAKIQIEHTQLGDMEATSISADAFRVPFLPEQVPGQVHLAATGSYLWFAIGGPGTREKLEGVVNDRDTILNGRVESIALLVRLRLSEWMGDHEGASRTPQLFVQTAEQQLSQLFSGMFRSAVRIGNVDQPPTEQRPFTGYAEKILEKNASDFELSVRSYGRTLTLDAQADPGVVKFLAAQYVAAQSQVFNNVFLRVKPAIESLNKDGKKGTKIQFFSPGQKG